MMGRGALIMALVLVPTAHNQGVGFYPKTLEERIYELKPATSKDLARRIGHVIRTNCAPRNWFDALHVAFLESSFRVRITNSTGDYGLFQLNGVHGDIAAWSLQEQTKYACERIAWAKRRGGIGFYHSKTRKHRVIWCKRLERVRSTEKGCL
jgi:hypothetical protein